jgi:2-keto-4-pentenoate hydratase
MTDPASAPGAAGDPRIAAGLVRQAAERSRLLDGGASRLGWKAGFGTSAAMAKLGTTAPLIGFMTDQGLLDGDGPVAIGDWTKPVLEPEVAVRLGQDLAPGADREAVAAAIEAVATAIELVDITGPGDDVEAILSNNIFHRYVAIGPFARVSDDLRLDQLRLEVVEGEEARAQGADPAELLGDLVDVVRHLADQAPGAGDQLRAGDVIITGSVVPGIAVSAGERFEVRADGLGSVAVRLA